MTRKLTDHEKLKTICDEIGYEMRLSDNMWRLHDQGDYIYKREEYPQYDEYGDCVQVMLDVREIIFQSEFMDYLTEYLGDYEKIQDMWANMMDNLDDPCSYLYNLLNLGIEKKL